MKKNIKISPYHSSLSKRCFDIFFSSLGLIILLPLFCLISILVATTSGFPIFFIQRRIGLGGKEFKILKFRTMVRNAGDKQRKFYKINEADGPVFKIYNDPRFTVIGKILSRLGLDELPQLINVLKGDMSLVGPRPLPVYEARQLTEGQKFRESIKPGITSLWVIEGSHNISFIKWMDLDLKYMENASLTIDFYIILKTLLLLYLKFLD